VRIHTSTTWNLEDMSIEQDEWTDYAGPVALMKGGGAKEKTDYQVALANARTKEASTREKELLDMVKSSMARYLTAQGEGYSPEQLSLLTTQFLHQNANDYSGANVAVRSALASRGAGTGTQPVGGDYVRGMSNLYGAQAQNLTSGLTNIGLSNLQQAVLNRMNAAGILSGNANTYAGNIASYSGVTQQGIDTTGRIAAANAGANAGLIGAGIGAITGTGGLSSLWKNCWVAEATFGLFDPRTLLLRQWLNTSYRDTFIGGLVMRLYDTYGQKVAAAVYRHPRVLRPIFRAVFNRALARAVEEI
jgi:hypothetical protein